jgi:integrase
MGERMEDWKKKVNAILAKVKRENDAVVSHRTMDATRDVIYCMVNTLHKLGNMVQDPMNVGHKHISKYVEYRYFELKRKPVTLKNDISRLKAFYRAAGKPNLVLSLADYLPGVDPTDLVVPTAAETSKSWTENGIDVAELIRKTDRKDEMLGLMFRMALAFGMRGEELLHCQPWQADHGGYLRVFEGQGKGGKSRNIPFETDLQREVADYVQSRVRKGQTLGWKYTRRGKPANLKQNLKRYHNTTARLGITKKVLGITPHGLRAQYAENAALRQCFIPATLGGTSSNLGGEELAFRRTKVSLALGHNRDKITAAYYGPLIRKHNVDDRDAFRATMAEAVTALSALSLEPIPDDRLEDVAVLTNLLLVEDRVEMFQSQVHHLWRLHSARYAVDWAPFDDGVRQGLQVAARRVINVNVPNAAPRNTD